MRVKLRLPQSWHGQAWKVRMGSGDRHPHHHDELEFNLLVRGQARYLVGDRRHDLRRHTLIWLFPRQDHVLLDWSADMELWVVIYQPALVSRLCADTGYATLRQGDPPGRFCRDLDPLQSRRLDGLLQDLSTAPPPRGNAGLAYSLLLAWDLFQAAEDLSPVQDVHPAVERAVRLIRDSDEAGSLPHLARQVGMSPWRLSRLFKRQTGVSLAAYRQRQRLQRFLDLCSSDHPPKMLDAALDSGFGSYAQFHRVFTQYMGRSPAEYFRGRGEAAT